MNDETLIKRALMHARDFIRNGVALGFIHMPDPDCPDPAHETPKLIDAALEQIETDALSRPVEGWQPIETAPKDGTPVLVCVAGYDATDRFGWRGRAPFTAFFGTYHPNAPGAPEWRDDSGHRRPYITHWMPLPQPPSVLPAPPSAE